MKSQSLDLLLALSSILVSSCLIACDDGQEQPSAPPSVELDMPGDAPLLDMMSAPDESDMRVDAAGDMPASVDMSTPNAAPVQVSDVVIDDALFVSLPAVGRSAVVLHPHERVTLGESVEVQITIPFPKNVLFDGAAIQLHDSTGAQLASHSEQLLSWHTASSAEASVRAVRTTFAWTFSSHDPVELAFVYGITPTSDYAPSGGAQARYPLAEAEFFPGEYDAAPDLTEPAVFATFSPEWLGASLLRTRTSGQWPGFDPEMMTSFAQSAVNDVGEHVTEPNKIAYQTAYEPWLFDRAGTLWNMYILTGEVKWLRHALRASHFYKLAVQDTGYFSLKSSDDLKYSYTHSMFVAYALTGDESFPGAIREVARAASGDGFNPLYEARFGFWTERHLAYKLQPALTMWELDGDRASLDTVLQAIVHNLGLAANPGQGWTATGCILHTVAQHEGAASEEPICSPWMMGLYAELLWRVYLVTEDTTPLEQLSAFGDYLSTYGVYERDGVTLPYYLSGPGYDSVSAGASSPDSDREHACDVAGLAYRAAYAKSLRGEDMDEIRGVARDLTSTCQVVIPGWIRTSQATVDAGKTFYRLAPPRKFNWWFGTTSDLGWLAR